MSYITIYVGYYFIVTRSCDHYVPVACAFPWNCLPHHVIATGLQSFTSCLMAGLHLLFSVLFSVDFIISSFLPRCMECRHGLAMRILSVRLTVRPSVCLSHTWIVTKQKKDLSRFLHHTKD